MQRGEDAKVTEENKSPSWRTLGCLYAALFAVVCFPITFCVLSIAVPMWIEKATFCSTDNEIYHLMENNAEDWIDGFTEWNSVIRFETSDGRTHVAIGGSSSFFVPIESSRKDIQGSWGFYYHPAGKPYIHALYRIEYLAGDVYCYWRDASGKPED